MGTLPLGEQDLERAAPVLDFFRARTRLPPIGLDGALAEDALCLRDGIRLHPRLSGSPLLPGVLAHELFHAWSRRAIDPARWGALPRRVPLFCAERAARAPALAGANVEELAADLLAERLCARAGVPFHAAYLIDLPPGLLSERLEAARIALGAAALPRTVALDGAAIARDLPLLGILRESLRRLSGFELAALALHGLRAGDACPPPRWPALLATGLPPALRALPAALEALDAPSALELICAAFAAPTAALDRSPLWGAASPLESSDRELARRLRDPALLTDLRTFLQALGPRLSAAAAA